MPTVRFRFLDKPKEVQFSIKLSKLHTYDDIVTRLAQRLGLNDPSKIRLTSHDCYSRGPKPQPIMYRGVEHLSDMLENQSFGIVYYEVLDIPLPELQCLEALKIAFHHATRDEVRLKKEQEENEQKRKEKAEAHLYTTIKVTWDEDLFEQIGKDIFFDLVDHDKVRSFRVKKQMPFTKFKEEVARVFGIPVLYQRFWLWAKRQNFTYRPDRPLTPKEETQPIGQLREVANKTNQTELKLFLELEIGQDFRPIPPLEKTKEDLLLFFKLYNPSDEKLRYVGRFYVTASGKPLDIISGLKQMAGFAMNEEIELFEEIRFDPSVMCECVDLESTFQASQLEDGDIICYQKTFKAGNSEQFRYPYVPSFLEYVHNRVVLRIRFLEKPKEDQFSIELSKLHTYGDVVIRVAQHLRLNDPSKIRVTSHDWYSQQPKAQPITYRGGEHLSDMLVKQTSDILYYEVLDFPLPELQCLNTFKFSYRHATRDAARLTKEQEKVQKRKEKAEAHLYTIIKVTWDEDLFEQIGKHIFFDLVDHDKVRSFRVKKQMPFPAFKEEVARVFGIPVLYQRFWLWAKRQNVTYRPHRPLTPQEETQPIGELREVSNKANNAELKLFLELEIGPDFRPIPPLEKTEEDLLLFFKLYDPSDEKLRYVGRFYVTASGKPLDILSALKQMAGFAMNEEIELFEEIKFEPSVMCERVDLESTFRASQLEDGDIICYQKSPKVGIGKQFRYPDVPSFLAYMHNRVVSSLSHHNATTFGSGASPSRHPAREVSWPRPVAGRVVLNVDGSALTNPGKAGFGGLVRDHNGCYLVGFHGSLGFSDIIHAEVMAILHGLQLCWDRGWRDVACYTDSLIAVKMINEGVGPFHRLANELAIIRRFSRMNWSLSIQHTLREGNFCADFLAKLGARSDEALIVLDNSPVGLHPLLLADASGVVFTRP